MKMTMKDTTIAACGIFAAFTIGINYWVPINAFAAFQQAGAPLDEIMQDVLTASQGWNATSVQYAKASDTMYKAYGALKAENAQLKDDLAKAKAPPPSPVPTPAPTKSP